MLWFPENELLLPSIGLLVQLRSAVGVAECDHEQD